MSRRVTRSAVWWRAGVATVVNRRARYYNSRACADRMRRVPCHDSSLSVQVQGQVFYFPATIMVPLCPTQLVAGARFGHDLTHP